MHAISKHIRKYWAVLALFLEILKLSLRLSQLADKRECSASIGWFWWRMALCHWHAGRLREAEYCSRHYIAVMRHCAGGHWLLSKICFEQKKYSEAMTEANQSLALDHNFWGAYEVKGKILLSQGEWNDAARQFRQALWISDKDKSDAEVHALIASAYEKLGRLEEAGKHWRRAIELNSDDD